MVSRSYSNLLELTNPTRTTTPEPYDDVWDDPSSSSPRKDRVIIVANKLPVRAQKTSGQWCFTQEDNSLYLQLKDGLSDDVEVFYVGCLNAAVETNEQDEVSLHLLENFNCVPAFISDGEYDKYYHGFCKQQLWPLFHYMLSLSSHVDTELHCELWTAYVTANVLFSDRIMELLNSERDFVWVQDYHLMAVPAILRKRFNRVRLGYFHHSPFPSSEIYRTLPGRRRILRSMLNCDLIGFHTFDYARHFLTCCGRILGLSHELKRGYIGVEFRGRTVTVKILPVGIHLNQVESALRLPETLAKIAELKREFLERERIMLLGVDDMDIFKGISLKLLAMEHFLSHNVNWRGRVVLVQIANPARTHGKEVSDVRSEAYTVARRINERFGREGYDPVILIEKPMRFYEKVAYYAVAESCLVTAVRDGMNLIPYEYVIGRQGNDDVSRILNWPSEHRESTLVLSEFIGCSPSLSGALRVNPWNIEAVSDAISEALRFDASDKCVRHRKHYKYIESHDATYWAKSFLHDLDRTTRDHWKKKYWRHGFGLGFRVVSVEANFRRASTDSIVSAYRKATNRAIIMDYEATLMPSWSINKSPSLGTINMLKTLSDSSQNVIILTSARTRRTLSEWFSQCANLGLAAENGFFLRLSRDSEWETCVSASVLDTDWKEVAMPIMQLYTELTDGSRIEDKEASLVWNYEDSDRDFGLCQAKELLDHLGSVLANEPVTVKRGQTLIEVKPQGVSKGLVVKRQLYHMKEQNRSPDFVLCVGGERSDEEMFEMLRSSVAADAMSPNVELFSCTVGSKPSKAQYYLEDTAEIIQLMRSLASVTHQQSI